MIWSQMKYFHLVSMTFPHTSDDTHFGVSLRWKLDTILSMTKPPPTEMLKF